MLFRTSKGLSDPKDLKTALISFHGFKVFLKAFGVL